MTAARIAAIRHSKAFWGLRPQWGHRYKGRGEFNTRRSRPLGGLGRKWATNSRHSGCQGAMAGADSQGLLGAKAAV